MEGSGCVWHFLFWGVFMPRPNPLQRYNPHKHWLECIFDPLQGTLQSRYGCNKLICHHLDAGPNGVRRLSNPHAASAHVNERLRPLSFRGRLNGLDVIQTKPMWSSRNAGVNDDFKRWH